MDPTSNFLSYRSTLRAAVSRSEGATDQRQRVVVPFFSLLIKVGTSSIKFLSEKKLGRFRLKQEKIVFNKTVFSSSRLAQVLSSFNPKKTVWG
jgi:hypothetical protein